MMMSTTTMMMLATTTMMMLMVMMLLLLLLLSPLLLLLLLLLRMMMMKIMKIYCVLDKSMKYVSTHGRGNYVDLLRKIRETVKRRCHGFRCIYCTAFRTTYLRIYHKSFNIGCSQIAFPPHSTDTDLHASGWLLNIDREKIAAWI